MDSSVSMTPRISSKYKYHLKNKIYLVMETTKHEKYLLNIAGRF